MVTKREGVGGVDEKEKGNIVNKFTVTDDYN